MSESLMSLCTSGKMQPIRELIAKVAATNTTVLLRGESGVGKEVVARAIHKASPRAGRQFLKVNCAALPAELLESELFGHARGAFTGAVADKPGKFEAANGGTIFLDEIGTMPMHLQMKLLRVLQEHEVERVGTSKKIKLNVRVISATNANIEDEVKRGAFREDLYYRLNVIPILLPPLRERREDIAVLDRHFLLKSCKEMNRPLMSVSAAAMQALEAYDWPGNVREMENVIERALVLGTGSVINVEDLPESLRDLSSTAAGVAGRRLADIEREHIIRTLRAVKGNKAAAARVQEDAASLLDVLDRAGLTVGAVVEKGVDPPARRGSAVGPAISSS